MLIADSDLPPSISPLTPNPIETLDESIGVQSLALDDDRVSIPTPIADGHETLMVPSLVSLDHGECSDVQVMPRGPDEFEEPFLDIWNHPDVAPGYDTDDEYAPLKMIDEPNCVGAGLWNLGNSCFVNSVLQCLTHTVPLIESLSSYKSPDPCHCGNEWFCVINALRDHIESALTTSRRSLSPYHFLNNLNYFSADLRRYQQEDAHEFLQAFLDKLERCCVDRSSDRDSVSSQDVNLVQRIFGGRLVSMLHCCNCNSVSETFENSLGLSLGIEDVDNLQSALDSFTRVEKLDDLMTCDDCKEKVSKEKRLLLYKLPEVVTFHLKRFQNNGFFMGKIFNHVAFPLEIDLQPYMSQNNEVTTKYRLYAFVEHFGSLAYGHYSSYVRSAPKIWHQFDDKQVTRIDEDRVLSQDAYILFYAREGVSLFSSTFEELRGSVDASLQNPSPNSVLDPTNGECSSEISYENVYKPNKRYDETAGVTDLLHVKPEEKYVSLSNEFDEDVLFQSAETTGDDSVPYLMVQHQDSSQKQHEGMYQFQLEKLETTKDQEEEEPYKQPLLVSDVAEHKETEKVNRRGLMKKPSPRERVLDQVISTSGSPPKKTKKSMNNVQQLDTEVSCGLS